MCSILLRLGSFKHSGILALVVGMVLMCGIVFATPAAQASEQGDTPETKELDLAVEAKAMEYQAPATFGCFGGDSEKGIVEGCFAYLAYTFMVTMAMLAVWVSGGLNVVVGFLVVGMGQLVGNMPGVTVAWELLRDLANVFLVFLTVFIGLATIVGNTKYGAKQLLFRVILAALFVNFSITIAKVVIDVSNVFAIEAYTMLIRDHVAAHGGSAIPDCAERSLFGANIKEDSCVTIGVAGAFWSQMEVMKMFNISEFKGQGQGLQADKNIMWVGLAGGLMFLVLAFVFGAATVILLTRFVVLVLLIIVSPLAFVMWVTGVSNQGSKWWHMLINQSLVAPAMFLMWWIAYKMVDEMGNVIQVGQGEGIAQGGMNDMGSIAILTFFFIVIAMLIASLVVAKELGSRAAGGAMSIGKKWSRSAGFAVGAGAGALTAGTIARSGRFFVGGAGNTVANSATAANLAGSKDRGVKGFVKRSTGRAMRGAGLAAAGANYDVRSAPLVGSTAQKYLGKSKTGGRLADIAAKKKKIDEQKTWLAETKPTAKDASDRDNEQVDILAANERAQAHDESAVQKNTEQLNETIEELNKELEAKQKDIDTANASGDPTRIAEAQERYDATKTKRDEHKNIKESLETRQKIRMELASGQNLDTGLDLEEHERADRESRLTDFTQHIQNSYGVVDEDVKKIETQIEKTRAAQATATPEKRRELEKELQGLEEERNAWIQLHEANRELHDLGDSWTAQGNNEEIERATAQAQQAKNNLAARARNKAKAVDKSWENKWRTEADERVQNYLTGVSTRYSIPGMVGPAQWKREHAMKLRGASKEEKLFSDFEAYLKRNAPAADSTQDTQSGSNQNTGDTGQQS